jgi:hypothetical protein
MHGVWLGKFEIFFLLHGNQAVKGMDGYFSITAESPGLKVNDRFLSTKKPHPAVWLFIDL